MVRALALVVDLVLEPAPAPRLVAVEAAAVALDRLARAGDDLVLPLLGQLGIEHEQDFIVGHAPETSLPSV